MPFVDFGNLNQSLSRSLDPLATGISNVGSGIYNTIGNVGRFAGEHGETIGPLLGGGLGFAFGGPAGAGLGAQLGALGGSLAGGLVNKTETPFQQQAREAQLNLLSQLSQRSPFQKVSFDPIRQQEISRFQQEIVPQLSQQFASTPGGLGSSYFQKALGQAGAGLSERLAALQAQHETGQQASQLAAGGQDLSRLGQLQSFLQGNQLAAAQQEAARRSQLVGLLGLGQQIAQQQVGQQRDTESALGQQYRQAGQFGTAEPGKAPPGLTEGFIRALPQILSALGAVAL